MRNRPKLGKEEKMNYQKLLRQMSIVTLVVLFLVVWVAPIAISAIVVDTDGKTYKVEGLKAKYTAGGTWIGGRPTTIKESLFIVFEITENRVTFEEKLEIPFASVRRFVFKGASVPGDLKDIFRTTEPIRIEKLDGSIILLSQVLLIERDAEGNQVKKLELHKYSFRAGKTQGQSIILNGFSGRSKTESGKKGDFWIPLGETCSIEFETP
ncbi:hypothetical protein ES703_95037 [subsurface metagenome]